MRPAFYDLHIHSCLSPCGDMDMTPNNILNMALLKELDLIALTEEPESEAENAEDRALASSSDVPPAASDSPRPRFQDRCLEVAAAFELSPKETEVMILFAKGRSAARIQEELFISKGTVSTHLRHIYQKMDVHSKQEMLDVIEGVIRE